MDLSSSGLYRQPDSQYKLLLVWSLIESRSGNWTTNVHTLYNLKNISSNLNQTYVFKDNLSGCCLIYHRGLFICVYVPVSPPTFI